MSTNNDGWILMSERKPTKADFPVWCHQRNATDQLPTWIEHDAEWFPFRLVTHWKPAAADIPAPPREKTQGEADDAAFQEWREVAPASPAYMAWHAALAYERAEVNKMLPDRPQIEPGRGELVAVIEAIRARCGGGK